MAKDAKGHGSEAHGAGVQGAVPTTDQARKGLMTDAQLAQLRSGYAGIKTVDPSQPSYGKLTALLDASSPSRLSQLAGANIKFVSSLARNRLPSPPTPTVDRAKLNRTYNRNESNNYHSENIALLAKNFGTADEHAKAREIVSERDKQGGLPTSTKSVPDVRNWQYGIHQKYIKQLTG